MLNQRFLSPTDQKCANSSTYWQFFHYRPPGIITIYQRCEVVPLHISGYTAGGIARILCKNSIYSYIYIYMYIERLTLSIIIDIDRQHWKSCTAVATSEWHTVKICKHSHNRLIDNIGDYLYFKNQRMEASNLKLIHISSTWDCTTFHNFLPMFQKKKKKDLKKLAGLWLADEVVNHVGIYGSKAAEGLSAFQRRSCWKFIPTSPKIPHGYEILWYV